MQRLPESGKLLTYTCTPDHRNRKYPHALKKYPAQTGGKSASQAV